MSAAARSHSRLGALAALAVLLAFATPTANAIQDAGAAGAALEHPDLAGLEPAVASQLRLARARFERLASADPGSDETVEALGELALLYHAYGFGDAALGAYEQVRERSPSDPRWPHAIGLLHRSEGRAADAERAWRAALELPGALPAVRTHLARLLLEQNRLDEASQLIAPALAAERVDPAVIACAGEIALARGDAAEAARLLDLALGLVPSATRLHYPLASALRALGDGERARRHLEQAGEVGLRPADPLLDRLERLPTGEVAHLQRAERAFAHGLFDDAANEFRSAAAAAPNSVAPRIGLAAALASGGRLSEAAEELRRALLLEPDNATAHYDLGSVLLASGFHDEAASHLRRAISLDPDDAAARLALARTLAAAGKSDAAIAEARSLVASDPAVEDAWLLLAQWLVERGDWRAALNSLEQARGALPSRPRIAATLARALASAPRQDLRDGERAHSLALDAFAADETAVHAEIVALTLGELGRCTEAAVWQREALSRLDGSEPEDVRRRFLSHLERYDGGAPCGLPVADEGPP